MVVSWHNRVCKTGFAKPGLHNRVCSWSLELGGLVRGAWGGLRSWGLARFLLALAKSAGELVGAASDVRGSGGASAAWEGAVGASPLGAARHHPQAANPRKYQNQKRFSMQDRTLAKAVNLRMPYKKETLPRNCRRSATFQTNKPKSKISPPRRTAAAPRMQPAMDSVKNNPPNAEPLHN